MVGLFSSVFGDNSWCPEPKFCLTYVLIFVFRALPVNKEEKKGEQKENIFGEGKYLVDVAGKTEKEDGYNNDHPVFLLTDSFIDREIWILIVNSLETVQTIWILVTKTDEWKCLWGGKKGRKKRRDIFAEGK